MRMEDCRSNVVDIGCKLVKNQVVVNGQGNISCRLPDQNLIAITPSAVPYLEREAEDICLVDVEGKLIEGKWKPTTEIQLHLIYYQRRSDVHAVVHTHAPFSTIFGITGEVEMPLVLNEAAMALGSPVPVAPYARPGTRKLARVTFQATRKKGTAVIMAHHGLVTVGDTLEEAYTATIAAEHTAQAVCTARSMGVNPSVLPEDEVQELRRLYSGYGVEPASPPQDDE